jgi:hypothetical protein
MFSPTRLVEEEQKFEATMWRLLRPSKWSRDGILNKGQQKSELIKYRHAVTNTSDINFAGFEVAIRSAFALMVVLWPNRLQQHICAGRLLSGVRYEGASRNTGIKASERV